MQTIPVNLTPDESLRKKVMDAFRQGVKLACAREIWTCLKKEVTKLLQDGSRGSKVRAEVASAAVTDWALHSEFQGSRFQHGGMPDKSLFIFMTCLQHSTRERVAIVGAETAAQPPSADEADQAGIGPIEMPLPLIRDRALIGFCYVAYVLKFGKQADSAPNLHDLAPERFLAVRSVAKWLVERRIEPAELSVSDWDEIRRKHWPALIGGGERMKEIYQDWHETVSKATHYVEYDWAVIQ